MSAPGHKPPPGGKVTRVELRGLSSDARGWGMNPVRQAGAGPGAAAQLHVVSIRPGASRGHHAHGNATEWILVFGGPAKLTWTSPADAALHEEAVTGPDPVLFEIPSLVEHVITNTGDQDIYAVAFYDHPAPETLPAETLPTTP